MPTEDRVSVVQGGEEQAEGQKASARVRPVTEQRSGPGQAPELLWASAFPSVEWRHNPCPVPPQGCGVGMKRGKGPGEARSRM